MQYLFYILLIAVIFGLIALADKLLQLIFPKNRTQKQGNAVRMPRYSLILGVILTVLAVVLLLFLPENTELFLRIGSGIVLLMGLYLLVSFWRFAIFYDDEQFIYRTLTRKARTYRYADIEGQQSFVAKSGLNTTLYAAGDEIRLYSAMQGFSDFLNKAFFRWCEQTGTDPDTVENNPAMLVFFPEPTQK